MFGLISRGNFLLKKGEWITTYNLKVEFGLLKASKLESQLKPTTFRLADRNPTIKQYDGPSI